MGIFDFLFGDDKDDRKRIFISFSMDDVIYRNYLVQQARQNRSSFDFIDMSVKKPWKEREWQKRCRSKIKRCHGAIVLLSPNTYLSDGARWEIKCIREERIPIVGMYIRKNEKGTLPPELKGKRTMLWSWDNLEKFIDIL